MAIKIQGNTKIQGKSVFAASSPTPTYTVTSNAVNGADEGNVITFTLNTTNVDNGTVLPYTITGITQQDLSSGSLTGNFTVNNNTATASITLANDALTEGAETATLTLDSVDASVAVTVNDTSMTPTYAVTYEPVGNHNEGDTVTFTLSTTNVANGTQVPYTISGISSDDLSTGSLTGNFTVNNNTATASITLANDVLTEGSEYLRLTLDNGSDYKQFEVIDTSRSFLPEDLANLVAHFDYRSGVYKDTNNTPAATDDNVRLWKSRINSVFLPQFTLSLQPFVLQDGGLYFSSKCLGSSNVFNGDFSGINGPLTYYIVGKNFTANSIDVPIVKVGGGTLISSYRFSFSSGSAGNLRMSNGSVRPSNIYPYDGDDRPVIISANFNNGNGNIYKGTNVGTIESLEITNIGTGLNSANTPTAFTLGGRHYTSSTQTLTDTTIYHVLVYKAIHTNSERLQVMNYLKSNTRNGSVSF